MQTDINREWWKIKIYNEISNYLRHPSSNSKQQLDIALLEYEQIFRRLATANDVANLDNMELSMNDF